MGSRPARATRSRRRGRSSTGRPWAALPVFAWCQREAKVVRAPILGDEEFELDEEFVVIADDVVGALVARDEATGVIYDNDAYTYAPPADGEAPVWQKHFLLACAAGRPGFHVPSEPPWEALAKLEAWAPDADASAAGADGALRSEETAHHHCLQTVSHAWNPSENRGPLAPVESWEHTRMESLPHAVQRLLSAQEERRAVEDRCCRRAVAASRTILAYPSRRDRIPRKVPEGSRWSWPARHMGHSGRVRVRNAQ